MGYPNFPNVPPPSGPWRVPDPGSIPLRPLTVGDLFGVGLAVVRRHLALLGPIAIVIAAVASAVDLAILSTTGALHTVATGSWIDDLQEALSSGRADLLPTGLYLSSAASSVITLIGVLFLSAIATACIGVDAVTPASTGARNGNGAQQGSATSHGDAAQRGSTAAAGRLRGRIGAALVVAILVGISIMVGSFLLLIPGVAVFMMWSMAGPAAVMERLSPAAAINRSLRLTRGFRWRIFGISLLITVVTVAIESVIAAIVVALVPSLSAEAALVVGDIVRALVAAVTMSWLAAVIALLYVDIRIRNEHLGEALRAHAQRRAQG